jgi:hypothetical protein
LLPTIQFQLAAAVIAVGKPSGIVLLNGAMLAIEAEQRDGLLLLKVCMQAIEAPTQFER